MPKSDECKEILSTVRKSPQRKCKKTTNNKPSSETCGLDNKDVILVLEDIEEVSGDADLGGENVSGVLESQLSHKVRETEVKECGSDISIRDTKLFGTKSFQCRSCGRNFARKYHLNRHMQLTSCSGHEPPVHECNLCGKVYTRKDNLQEHLRQHSGHVTRSKQLQCPLCPKRFAGASLLKVHERIHSGEKPFLCEFCSKSFASSGAKSKHRRIHTKEKPYSCPDCGIRFSLKGTLNRHMRIHTGVRPHKCPHCDKEFIQAGGLKAHLFYHTRENGFRCDYCEKQFNRKARLQLHVRSVHQKDRPFECSECGKRFTRKEDLYRHTILHTGQKAFDCPQCDKSFAIKPSLKLHLLTHTKEEPSDCKQCGKTFIRQDCLLRHMRKRHRTTVRHLINSNQSKDHDHETMIKFLDVDTNKIMTGEELIAAISELLTLLVDDSILKKFGWPDSPIDQVLQSVIKSCGHETVNPAEYDAFALLRENSKQLFAAIINDTSIKNLFNNESVDEVILHVLRLAKQDFKQTSPAKLH